MSEQRVELPDDQYATLRDPRQVSVKRRRVWQKANNDLSPHLRLVWAQEEDESIPDGEKETATAADIETLWPVNDASILCFVREWSFPQPITQAGLDELPSRAYDALLNAVSPLMRYLVPNTDVQFEEDKPGVPLAGSPTSPSFGSEADGGESLDGVSPI